MAGNQVRIVASVDDKVTGPLGKIHDRFDTLGKSKGFQAVAQGVGMGAGISAFGLLDRAMSGAFSIAGDSIKAYQEEQDSVSRLGASLKANIPAWDGNTAAIEKVLTARMKLGFSDEDQRNSLALLVGATHDVNKALELQKTAMDLARFKQISLADASEALTRVEAGSYRILKSLGIVLKDGATQQDALNAVQRVAMGQTEEYATTDLGKLEIAQIKVNEAEEKFGKGLSHLEAELLPAAADAITILTDGLDNLGTGAARAAERWYVATNATIDATEHMRAGISERFHATANDVDKTIKALPDKIAEDLSSGYDAIHSASTSLGEALKNPIKAAAREKGLQDILNGKGSVGARLAAGLASADPVVRQKADKLRQAILDELAGIRNFDMHITVSGQATHGPRRAAGGPVTAGTSYLVGEQGPELFTPSSSGGITPHGGSSVGHPHVVILTIDRKGQREIARAVLDEDSYGRGNPTFIPA